MTQRVGINPMLQSDAGNDRGVARRVVNGCPALLGSEKDFSQSAILIMTDTGDVAKAAGLDIQEGMGTTDEAVDRGLPWGRGQSSVALQVSSRRVPTGAEECHVFLMAPFEVAWHSSGVGKAPRPSFLHVGFLGDHTQLLATPR